MPINDLQPASEKVEEEEVDRGVGAVWFPGRCSRYALCVLAHGY